MKKGFVSIMLIIALIGCTSEARHRIATALFDGVPPLEEKQEAAVILSGEANGEGDDTSQESAAAPAPVALETLVTHKPYQDRNCSGCHDFNAAAGSQKKGRELCFSCHDSFLSEEALVHVPVEADCLQCHAPHKSKFQYLTVLEAKELCLSCHEETALPHETDIGECTECHDPHQSPAGPQATRHYPFESGNCSICHDENNEYALTMEAQALCLMCHSNVLSGAEVSHPPAVTNCVSCHSPHQSQNAVLLKRSLVDLCLTCHAQTKVEEIHGAVLECMMCHSPHESESDSLLKF